jgi:hypothetical protein
VRFAGMQYRHDIGHRALKALKTRSRAQPAATGEE